MAQQGNRLSIGTSAGGITIFRGHHVDYDEPDTLVTPSLKIKIQEVCVRLGSLFKEITDEPPGASKKEGDGAEGLKKS